MADNKLPDLGLSHAEYERLVRESPINYDPVNHPAHYTTHPSGIECIQVIEHMDYNIGAAIKYLWRQGKKTPDAIQDLQKARWYIDREIQRLTTEWGS